jgi:hypothetical protein
MQSIAVACFTRIPRFRWLRAEVQLTVTSNTGAGSIADRLEEIARLPQEGRSDGFSGADHDRALYAKRLIA